MLRARCADAIEDIVAKHPEKTVVLVAHTVINRIILLIVLGLGTERFWHLRQDTCALQLRSRLKMGSSHSCR